MTEQRKRLVAIRCRVADILAGRYIKKDDLSPGYVITPFGLILSKVRINGIVSRVYVNDDKTYGFMTVEDGTGSIRVKFFNEMTKMLSDVNKGDWVQVVGRIREYNDEKYLVVDGLVRHDDVMKIMLARMDLIKAMKEFAEKRKILKNLMKHSADFEEFVRLAEGKSINRDVAEGVWQAENLEKEEGETKKEELEKEEAKDLVMRVIKENDEGEGVDYSIIIQKTGISENVIENVIDELLAEGTCYEPKPGKIKLV